MLLIGERSRRYGIGELGKALDFFVYEKKSGYVRITEEHDGLVDHYLIFLEGEKVASLTEGEKVKEYGKVALESFSEKHEEGIIETYLASKKGVTTFYETTPQAFFVEIKMEKEKTPPKKGTTFKIAGVEIKTVSSLMQMPTEKLNFPQMKKEIENAKGCMRLVCEQGSGLEEGCIIWGKDAILVFFEDEETLYGERALVRIMLMLGKKGVADLYAIDESHREELASLFSAARIKEMTSPEMSKEFKKEHMRREATGLLGLKRGNLTLESLFSGAFSFDIFLRTVNEKTLSGYLWLEIPPRFGLLYFENGTAKACLLHDGTFSFGREAFDKIFDLSGEGTLRFYQTPHAAIREKKALFEMSREEEADILARKVSSEMGQDMIKEIKGAQKFKKTFAEKREGEQDGVS